MPNWRVFACFSLLFSQLSLAQFCTPATSTLPITPTTTTQFTPYYSTGVPVFSFTGTAGCTYIFSTCGESSIDTYLRLHNSSFGLIGSWDDQCGFQTSFTWLCPTTGTYYLHLSRFFCSPLNGSTRVSYLSSCGNTPCSNPVVNAGPDVNICAGNATQLSGSVTAGSGGSGSNNGYLTVLINGSFLDYTSWNMTNSQGIQIGAGGPYGFSSNNVINITAPGPGPYTFFLETQGAVLNNSATYAISCNNSVITSGTLTPGLSTTLSIANCLGTGPSSAISYNWTPATGLSATNVLNPIASPTTTTTYTLTATQGNCTSQDQVVVTVNPTPIVSGTAQTFCAGSSVTLSANGTPSVGTYLWTPGGQTTNTITVSPSATTNYNVQYTIGGCSANSTISATQINGLDFANIQAPGTSSICEGNSITIYGQVFEPGLTQTSGQGSGISVQYGISTIDSNPSTWPPSAWSIATYNSTSLVNPNNDEYQATLSNLTPGTYYYAFSYTYNGCTVYGGYNSTGGGFWNGTTNVNGVMVVSPNITPNFSALPVICAGGTFPTLSTTSLEGITGSWSPLPNNLQTTTYTFTPTSGLCALPATTSVVVNSLPTVSIDNASNTTILNCTQTSISLNAVGSGSFAWANGVNPISTGSSISVSSPGTYSLVVLDQNGCAATTSITIAQDISIPIAVISTFPNTQVLTCSTPSITLNGSGGNTYVWSNGTATISTTSTTTITTPGTYAFSATAPNGCIDTEVIVISQDITPPVALIQNNTGTNDLNCNTTSILLNASGGLNYSWSNGTTVLTSTSNLTVNAPGTYTVTTTGANGCTDTETITINQQANTTPTFNAIGPFCVGTPFVLPTTSTNAVTGSWNQAPNFNATTTYIFTPTFGLCASPISLTVVVNPYPVIIAQNDTICAGNIGTITTQVSIPGGSYNWTGTSNNQANLSQTLNTTNSFQVIYSVLGCSDTANASIIVKPVPQVLTQNDIICSGEIATIGAFVDIPNGTYIWSNGSTSSFQSLSPNATTNYILVYTVNGCNSLPANATITVLPVPNITVSNQTICAGDPVTMQANANPAGIYYWGPNGVQGMATNTFTPTQDSTIEVFNVLNGCSSDTIQATITVLPLPISTFSANVLQGCVPLSVGFSADVLNNTTYTWQTSNQLSASGAQATLDFQINGSFSITLTATLNGCSSTTTVANMIEVDNYPIAAFEPSSQVFTEPNQALSFWNSSVGATTYQWNFGEGGSSSEEAPTHIFDIENEGTTVLLYAYSNLGCSDTASYYIGFDPGLVYYIPNSFTPDEDQFNQTFLPIFTSGIDPYNYQLLIYNRWGEVIFESLNPEIGWEGTFGQQGNPCPVGTYTYMITVKLPSVDERQTIKGHVNLIR
jgi:trimeric autotransporter adhesin